MLNYIAVNFVLSCDACHQFQMTHGLREHIAPSRLRLLDLSGEEDVDAGEDGRVRGLP